MSGARLVLIRANLLLFVAHQTMTAVVGAALGNQRVEREVARSSNALSIEAESLIGTAQPSPGSSTSVQNMQGFGPGWSGGAQLFWGAQAGGQLRLFLPTTVTGPFEVLLDFTRAPDFAIVRAQLGGSAPVTFNGYAPTVSRGSVPLGILGMTRGSVQLRLDVIAKDGKSTGFRVGLDRIELQPAAGRDASADAPGRPGRTADAAISGTTIPVLHIPASSRPRDDSPVRPTIPPLPMSARIAITQKALSSSGTPVGEPGTPIRLTPSAPQSGMSGMAVDGEFNTMGQMDYVDIRTSKRLVLFYEPLQPGRPHLLECGYVATLGGVVVRLSTFVGAGADAHLVELSSVPLEALGERLTAVVVPSAATLFLRLELAKGNQLRVSYCELTPFGK